VCPLHCQACSQSGDGVSCLQDRCDLGYGRTLEGKCEGNFTPSFRFVVKMKKSKIYEYVLFVEL